MFSQASVILFTRGGVSQHALGRHPQADTPQADAPQADTPPGRHPSPRQPLQWMVRILLECILVDFLFCSINMFILYISR